MKLTQNRAELIIMQNRDDAEHENVNCSFQNRDDELIGTGVV